MPSYDCPATPVRVTEVWAKAAVPRQTAAITARQVICTTLFISRCSSILFETRGSSSTPALRLGPKANDPTVARNGTLSRMIILATGCKLLQTQHVDLQVHNWNLRNNKLSY